MLPSLTTAGRRPLVRRALLGIASAVLAAGAIGASLLGGTSDASAGLSDALGPATWAMRVPTAWLAAPPPDLRRADALDLFAVRAGDRSYALPVAYAVVVVGADREGLVLELDEEDAVAIATAHAGGLLIVPLLRSTR